MANEVKLKLAIEGGQVVSATVDGVTTRLEHLGTQVKATSSASETLKTALGALATVGTALAIVKMADSVTTLRTALALSANSAADAGKAYNALFDIAQRGRVSFTELGTTYAAIARAGNEMGVSQSRLLTVTQSISQAMTIGGGSAASMQAALVQLGQGLGSGTLRGEELNSIMEQTPRLAKAIADGLGVPIGKLRELGMAGQLTGEQVIGALERSAPQLAKEMESATLTVGQAFTMLTNSAVKFAGDADNATGVTHGLASAMQNLSGGIDTVGNAIKEHETAFTIVTYGLAGAATAAGLAMLVTRLYELRTATLALGAAASVNPFFLGVMAVGAVGMALKGAADAFSSSAAGMSADVAKIKNEINAIYAQSGGKDLSAESSARLAKLIEAEAVIQKKLADLRAKYANENITGSAQSPDRLLARIDSEAQAKANADLGALKQKLSGVPQEYIDTMKKIGELHASGALVGKDYTDMLEKAHGLLKKSPATVSEAAKGITLYDDLMAQSAKVNANYTEQQNKLTAAYLVGEKGKKLSLDEYSTAMAVLVAQQPYMLANVKAQTAADAAAAKAAVEYGKQLDAIAMAEADAAQVSIDYARAMVEVNAATEFELSLLGKTAPERAIATKNRQIDLELEKQILAIKKTTAPLDAQAASIAAAQATAAAQRNRVASDAYRTEWQKTAETIRDSLTDAFMGAIDNGKSLFVNLRDSVVGMFKNMVLRPYIQATIGGVMGMGTGAAMADSGGASSLGAAGNIAGLYNTLSGGANVAMQSGVELAALAAKAGSQTLAGFAGGLVSTASMANATAAAQAGGSALAGVLAGSVLNGMAGYGIANAISDGYELGSVNKIAGIASMIPGVGPIAGVIGGLVTRMFGSKSWLESSGTTGTFGSQGFSGQNYAVTGHDPGFWSKNYHTTSYSALDPAQVRDWSSMFTAVQQSAAASAKALGLATTGIDNYTKSVNLAAGTTQEQITALFVGMADDMARAAAPGIDSLVKTGETASTTLSRLSTSLSSVNTWAARLDMTMLNVSLSSADAASKLVDLFGGVDNFAASSKAYRDLFFTDAERTAQTALDVAKALALVGVAMPATNDAFRGIVSGLELASEAGRNTFAVMMAVAPEFASVTKAATTYLDTLKATARADYQAARDKIDQTKAFSQSVKDLMLTLATSGSAAAGMTAAQARTRFTETNSLALNGDTTARSNLSDAATKYLEIAKASSQTSAQYAAAYAYVQSALATTALVTDAAVTVADQQLTALTTIASYLKEIDAKSATQNLTLGTLVSNAVASTAATLNMTAASAASVISANAPVIDNTKVTGDVLLDMNKNKGTSATTVSSGGGGNILTNLVSGAAGAVGSVVSGVTGAVGSVLGAIGGIFSDPRLKENISFSGQTSHGLNLYDYNYIGKPASERWRGVMSPEVRALYPDAVSNFGGYDRVNYAKLGLEMTKSPPGFALGGMHAGGLRIVGENGPELESTGPSRIWNASDTSAMLHSGGRDNARLEALVEALTLEVKALKNSAKDTADNTRTTAKTLVNVTRGGDAMQCASSSTATLLGV